MEPGRDGGRVNVLMYARSEDNKHEDTNQQRTTLEAGKPSIYHIASIIPSCRQSNNKPIKIGTYRINSMPLFCL